MKHPEQERKAMAQRDANAKAKACGLPLPYPNPWDALMPKLQDGATDAERLAWVRDLAARANR